MSNDPASDARIESETEVLGQASDAARQMDRLLDIMVALRDPTTGCPWDIEQDFETIVPYTIEEAYEVADAIARRDMEGLRDELGDLLFQSVFHAQMAAEAGAFDFRDVVKAREPCRQGIHRLCAPRQLETVKPVKVRQEEEDCYRSES